MLLRLCLKLLLMLQLQWKLQLCKNKLRFKECIKLQCKVNLKVLQRCKLQLFNNKFILNLQLIKICLNILNKVMFLKECLNKVWLLRGTLLKVLQ